MFQLLSRCRFVSCGVCFMLLNYHELRTSCTENKAIYTENDSTLGRSKMYEFLAVFGLNKVALHGNVFGFDF